jgi:tetratricopeptide (TPR) repeat protein
MTRTRRGRYDSQDRTWWRCGTLSLFLLVNTQVTHAQEARDEAPAAASQGAESSPQQREQAAKSAFQAGVQAAEAGDYAHARELFLRSRALVVKASTLLNLAVADLKLGLAEEALSALEAFDASGPESARLRERARELRGDAERLRQQQAPVLAPSLPPSLPLNDEPRTQVPLTSASAPRAPSAPPPSLGPPRALLIAGCALTTASIGGALWWMDRSRAIDACHKDELQCLEHAQIERQQRAAMAMTLSLATAGLGLLTGGAVWLAQRKHDQHTHTYVSAWGFKGSAGAVLSTIF